MQHAATLFPVQRLWPVAPKAAELVVYHSFHGIASPRHLSPTTVRDVATSLINRGNDASRPFLPARGAMMLNYRDNELASGCELLPFLALAIGARQQRIVLNRAFLPDWPCIFRPERARAQDPGLSRTKDPWASLPDQVPEYSAAADAAPKSVNRPRTAAPAPRGV